MSAPVCPECAQGKHVNCAGQALDPHTDELVDCECPHGAGRFQEELRSLLNQYSAEAPSGTPDFILAVYLTDALKAYNEAVSRRAEWRGETVDLPTGGDQ